MLAEYHSFILYMPLESGRVYPVGGGAAYFIEFIQNKRCSIFNEALKVFY